MKTSFLAAAVLLGSATHGFAADGSSSGRQGICPARGQGEARSAYVDRTHDACEVRWRDLVASHRTGGQTHDEFINVCARKCFGPLGQTLAGAGIGAGGAGLVAAAVIAGGVGVGVAASDGGSSNTGHSSPPASP